MCCADGDDKLPAPLQHLGAEGGLRLLPPPLQRHHRQVPEPAWPSPRALQRGGQGTVRTLPRDSYPPGNGERSNHNAEMIFANSERW